MQFLRQLRCASLGRFTADQYPIQRCRRLLDRDLRGPELALHSGAEVLGVLLILEGADLHAVEIRGRHIARGGDHLNTNTGNTGAQQLNLTGGGFGYIDDSPSNERPPIDNANVHLPSVGQVCNANPSIERHCPMGRHQGFRIEDLAVGSRTAVIRRAVPTGNSFFRCSYRNCRRRFLRRANRTAMLALVRASCGQQQKKQQ